MEIDPSLIATFGVPQGSSFGPLFFMFINDITSVLNCDVPMFADHIKALLPISGKEDHLTLQ